MEISQLDNIVSVKLGSSLYGMTMAEIVNSDQPNADLELLTYPVYDADQQLIGQLNVVQRSTRFSTQYFYFYCT